MHGVYVAGIAALCIAIIYWLDAPNGIASWLWSFFSGRETRVELRKPLGCNTCMTFWVTLFILLGYSPGLFWLSFVMAWFAKYLYYILDVLDKLIMRVLTYFDDKL